MLQAAWKSDTPQNLPNEPASNTSHTMLACCAGCLCDILSSMVAAHARFRRLPGAMRVLAVELCHYLDILVTCAAAKPPSAPSPADTAAGAVPAQASITAPDLGTRTAAADLLPNSQSNDAVQPGPQAAQGPAHDADFVQLTDQEVPSDGTVSSEGVGVSTEQSAPPLVMALYEAVVMFVLEFLSDADAGAKPAEIAAPLQLHVRFLQIAQWQSAESASQHGPAAAAAEPWPEQGLDLPAAAVQRLLSTGTPLTRLRFVGIPCTRCRRV